MEKPPLGSDMTREVEVGFGLRAASLFLTLLLLGNNLLGSVAARPLMPALGQMVQEDCEPGVSVV